MMSLLHRKPKAVTQEFESWLPVVTTADDSASAVPASAKPGRTRTSQEHLEAAHAALNAAAAPRG
jgi:hypothetical protein